MATVHLDLGTSEASEKLEDREILMQSVDKLLKRYLDLLDKYQKLQLDLGHYLSSGYLSLSQANFSNPTRTRYGQDHYDARMQASIHLAVKAMHPRFLALDTLEIQSIEVDSEPGSWEVFQPPTSNTKSSKGSLPERTSEGVDPLKWFGILVPPALKVSQNSFKKAVQHYVPAIASVKQELREVESEIRRARKQVRT